MGGNGSYTKESGGVPVANRTHDELPNRIDGHKILLQHDNIHQIKLPMNSNSEKPMYLCASVDRKTDVVTIRQIGIYRNHKIVAEIDLEYDKKGKTIPFSKTKGSHLHLFKENQDGGKGRKKHDKKNRYPVPRKYRKLIKKIVQYSKERHTYDNK